MNRRIGQALIAVLVLALASVAVAQMGPGMGRGWGMGPSWSGGGPGGCGGGPGWRGGGPGVWGSGYMASSLNLTDAQKQKAQSIFDAAYRQTQELRDQMYEKRQAYWNSQKPLTDAEIDKLSTERADLLAKMQSVHEKAFNNFYNNVLTAEQRTKYNDLRASAGPGPRMGGWGNGYGRRGRGWGW
jgi:Spy/CpxP family protein refolding chaperone